MYTLHNGNDWYAPLGTAVYAVRSGTVVYMKGTKDGNILTVRGDDGYYYSYCHLQNSWLDADGVLCTDDSKTGSYKSEGNGFTKYGDHVVAGQKIALSGGTGGFPPHLHLAIGTKTEPDEGSIWKDVKVANKSGSNKGQYWGRCRNNGYIYGAGTVWLLDCETFFQIHGLYNTAYIDEIRK